MDASAIVGVLEESLYLILVFCAFLGLAMVRGKQTLINLTLSLYLALLFSLKFPFYDTVLNGTDADRYTDSVIMIIIFALFTFAALLLFGKLMPRDYDEPAFEGFWKKLLFAIMASALVMAYSYHALPITEIITPGSPIQSLFAAEENFFWWLLLPLLGMFFL